MSFSPDDRFLLTVSECSSVAVWRVSDYTRLLVSDCFRDSGLLDLAWSPVKCNEFAVGGRGRLLAVCRLDERSGCSLQFNELDVPLVVREEHNDKFDFTALAYSEDYLLFAATNHGLVTVWSVISNSCFLNWQADLNEINVLVSVKHRLVSGSSKGSLKLWNIAAVHTIKQQQRSLENRTK
jgi:WD40 repeat protein